MEDSIIDGNAKYLIGEKGKTARELEQSKLDLAAKQVRDESKKRA